MGVPTASPTLPAPQRGCCIPRAALQTAPPPFPTPLNPVSTLLVAATSEAQHFSDSPPATTTALTLDRRLTSLLQGEKSGGGHFQTKDSNSD
jgi:hypothetical protein